jgi:hypothetical protein
MSRKARKPQETRTKDAIAQAALDRRKASELEEESVADRVRQNINDHGA